MAIIAYKISELYCVYYIKADVCKIKKRMTNKLFLIYLCVPVSTLGTMLTVFYSGIDTGSNMVLKILMTLFFCMHDNWKHDIVLCISKVYGKFK